MKKLGISIYVLLALASCGGNGGQNQRDDKSAPPPIPSTPDAMTSKEKCLFEKVNPTLNSIASLAVFSFVINTQTKICHANQQEMTRVTAYINQKHPHLAGDLK